jgi:hypothetical protein
MSLHNLLKLSMLNFSKIVIKKLEFWLRGLGNFHAFGVDISHPKRIKPPKSLLTISSEVNPVIKIVIKQSLKQFSKPARFF